MNKCSAYDRYDTFDSTPQIQDPRIFVDVHKILVQYERTYDRTCGVYNESKYSARYATTFFYCSVEQLREVTFKARTRTWCVVRTTHVTASLTVIVAIGDIYYKEQEGI